jgi:sterol desaturase/sphingolipid hydroxylase (fatty acid hydroxylase superfamily)
MERVNTLLITTPAVLVLFAILFLVERLNPLRESRLALWTRFVVNVAMSGLSYLTAAAIVRPSTLKTLDWAQSAPFGLLRLTSLPGWAELLIGVLLLDLSFYYWHLANHKIPFLWRFHNVHHLDPELDVSTGFRFHFGEVLLSTLFRVGQAALLGISFATFATYELVFQANTLFHHSNTRLPIRLERCLNAILVTPRMHGIHHSQVQRETNSNYGVVFSWWDRVHRTIGLNVPQSKIEIGVAGYSDPGDNRLSRALLVPFQQQRDYWRRSDGMVPQRRAEDLQPRPGVLAD